MLQQNISLSQRVPFYLIEDKLRDNKEVKIILQPEKVKKAEISHNILTST